MGNVFPVLHAASDLPAKRIADSALQRCTSSRPLVAELPYLFCGEFNGFGPLHLLADDTLGYAFSFDVPVVDTVIDGEEQVCAAVTAMLHTLAPGMNWQWFQCCDSNIDRSLELYRQQSGNDAAAQLFGRHFVARWHEARERGFFPDDPEINFFPRCQRITIALKSAPIGLGRAALQDLAARGVPERWRSALAPLLQRLPGGDRTRRNAAAFTATVRDVVAVAQNHGWTVQAMGAAQLVSWLAAILFPQRSPDRSAATATAASLGDDPAGDIELRQVVAAMGQIDSIDGGGFRSVAADRPAHHRMVSMLWPPRAVHAGLCNGLANLWPRCNVSVAAAALAPTAALVQLKARALLNARSTHRFNETEMLARTEALQEVERRLFADGERIVDLRLQVHLAEPTTDRADAAASAVCKYLQSLEMEAAVETDIGSSLLLRGCLPFAIYPRTEHKLRRRRRLLSRDGADLHPGGGAWTGIHPAPEPLACEFPSPIVMYSNALGEPLFIDPTKADKNPHALVIGQSGSGKSFFVHDYLLHLWRLPDIRLFLISIKADYRKLALMLGRYVDVHLDSDISLNPFAGAPTLENQARWFAALALMLVDDSSDSALSREAEVVLQAAALTCAQRNWDAGGHAPLQETVLEHICQELEQSAGMLGRQLSARLHPYRRGPFRRLFNAPRGVRPADRFVFFNLGAILRQPCAALAAFCIFGLIDETMSNPDLRAVPKGLIADEVWALVRNAHAAAILERSLKAYRSLGAFAVPIVQDPQDLDSPSGRVMLVNTATKIILPMDRSGHADLQRYVRLNERELQIVRDLRLVKRRYSEFFVSIDGLRSAKGLLIPDAMRYAVATTDPVDEHLIERFYRAEGNMLAAIERFAREMPFGIPPTAPPLHAGPVRPRAGDTSVAPVHAVGS